ncbi:MAG: RNA-binding domain-containing protein [Candidatus Hodarchaeota archaeon]
MSEVRPKSIELEVFVHATEDEEKVLQASFNLMPSSFKDKVKIRRDVLKGHHQNQIIVYRMKILGQKLAEESLAYLFDKFDINELLLLSQEMEMRLDETGTVHLRIDKQSAYRGKPVIRQIDDAIKVKINTAKPPALTNKDIIKAFRNFYLVKQ